MRKITEIILHCSATAEGLDFSVRDIRAWHKAQGWADVGYHYVVRLDGTVQEGRPLEQAGAHCKGHNAASIGICYIGGLAADGRTPKDTRTTAQRAALRALVTRLRRQFPAATVHGHNEFAAKACPCFNVRAEFGTDGTQQAADGTQQAAGGTQQAAGSSTRLRAFAILAAIAAAASLLFAGVASCTGARRAAVRTEQHTATATDDRLEARTSTAASSTSAADFLAARHVTDTVTVRDTLRVTERQQGCTLYVTRDLVRWRDRTLTRRDTSALTALTDTRTDTRTDTARTHTATARTSTSADHPPAAASASWWTSRPFMAILNLLAAAAALVAFIELRRYRQEQERKGGR